MMQAVDLNDFLGSIKAEVEKLEEVYECEILGRQFKKEDIENLSLDSSSATVLLTTSGAALENGPNPSSINGQTGFGLFFIASVDDTTFGHSPDCVRLAQKALKLIKTNQLGNSTPGATKLPDLAEMTPFHIPDLDGFAVWTVIWRQQLLLCA